MKINIVFQTLLFIISPAFLNAQTPDHKTFLREIENSSDKTYKACLQQFDTYLENHPDDVVAQIEKCKFIQFAQYDDIEEFNPNQEDFDSCSAALAERFPDHPEVLLFQTTYSWGDDLESVFEKAEKAIEEFPEKWSKANLGMLYQAMADKYYLDSEYQSAFTYIQRAIANDNQYKTSLEYVRILIELDRQPEALDVLLSGADTTRNTWELSQKADLFLELEAYSKALDIYNRIDEIDSTYNSKSVLANTLEGIGEYDKARKYLVADTSQNWNKETALRNLLIHDLKYQGGSVCIDTYNDFRDNGYTVDPIAIYRLKLFFSHPFQAWKFRDIPGMLCFIASIILLLILPFIWILPVYFIGHKWGWISRKKFYESIWGLKIFWIVSFGYLIASFLSVAAQPEYFYSLFNSYEDLELSENKKGFMSLLFTLIFAVFSLASLYKIKGSVLLSMNWPIRKSIFLSIGVLLAFKLITGVYIGIGLSKWGITADDLTGITNLLMSTRQDIEALMNTYGKGTGFVLICLLVPFYEEIVFRGVILDSCQRYINFNVANLIQSTLFATVHMSLFLFPVFFIFGIVTGIMRKKSGGLLAGFVFHIVNNVLAISLILIRSQN